MLRIGINLYEHTFFRFLCHYCCFDRILFHTLLKHDALSSRRFLLLSHCLCMVWLFFSIACSLLLRLLSPMLLFLCCLFHFNHYMTPYLLSHHASFCFDSFSMLFILVVCILFVLRTWMKCVKITSKTPIERYTCINNNNVYCSVFLISMHRPLCCL